MRYNIEEAFDFSYDDSKNCRNMIEGDHYRITIITSRLVRFEYDEKNQFCDLPTQKILRRDFGKVDFKTQRTEDGIVIHTDDLFISYDEKFPTASGLSIVQKKAVDQNTIWYFGQQDAKNLKGTARTLDDVDGETELSEGVLSQNGYAVIDDSTSVTLNPDGSFNARDPYIDIYYFGYGLNFKECISDFFKLTGKQNLTPRYLLGNWWSRFWEYDENSIQTVIDNFKKDQIPLSIFVMDMDWHIVNHPNGENGWTGFTWNRRLFPNPEKTLSSLKKQNIRSVLNLHPADGFRYFEEHYKAIKEKLGLLDDSQDAIPFDMTNSEFVAAYFDTFIEENEQRGVSFWWMDWQQGTVSKIKGLDPLWAINHYHYLHAQKKADPVIFSRYAGIGSHRYPIGFSGDTHITWESLKFQPYFTATSANVGYGCWSHDIGGHMYGRTNPELYVRWLQHGVFSPILRLHSGKSNFIRKEPWEYSSDYRDILRSYMQLRHRLIPYIYSSMLESVENNSVFIRPMYHEHPTDKDVYEYQNQYYFGDDILICPTVEPIDSRINKAMNKIYLPEGEWIDVWGTEYRGNAHYNYYTKLDEYAIFFKKGSITYVENNIDCNMDGCLDGIDVYLTSSKSKTTIHENDGKIEVSYDGTKLTVNSYRKIKRFNVIVDQFMNVISGDYQVCELGEISEGINVFEFRNVEKTEEPNLFKLIADLVNDCDIETAVKYEIENNRVLRNEKNVNLLIGEITASNLMLEQKQMIVSYLNLYANR